MVEEFLAMLSCLQTFKRGRLWNEAGVLLDAEFQKLVGTGAADLAKWSDTDLLARIIAGESTQVVREKTLLLTALLKEAGDVAAAQDHREESHVYYLKALHLLLGTLAGTEDAQFPEFVPRIDLLLGCLDSAALPLGTQALLMRHYEQTGQFAKAEDRLFAMLELEPVNPGLLQFGTAFYQRLESRTDTALEAGNLPRAELETGAQELRVRHRRADEKSQ
jgi:hypothetical protein